MLPTSTEIGSKSTIIINIVCCFCVVAVVVAVVVVVVEVVVVVVVVVAFVEGAPSYPYFHVKKISTYHLVLRTINYSLNIHLYDLPRIPIFYFNTYP